MNNKRVSLKIVALLLSVLFPGNCFCQSNKLDSLVNTLLYGTGSNDQDSDKCLAAERLGASKDKRHVEAVIIALKDKSSRVRSCAALALKTPLAVDPLIALLNSDDEPSVKWDASRPWPPMLLINLKRKK